MLSHSIIRGPGLPASLALTASPAAIAFDGSATATVTARVTDAAGHNVADNTPVTFAVLEHGSANPVEAKTAGGSASTTITPLLSAEDFLTVLVSSGAVTASIRIDRAGVANLFISSAWRVLSVLLEPPFVPHQQKEIARSLALPEASVQRGLRTLLAAGLIQRRRTQYVVGIGQDAVRYLWLLRQVERHSALPPDLVNALSIIIARDLAPDDCVIVFGSWTRGVAIPGESDVDVGVFSSRDHIASRRLFEGPYRIELQTWDKSELPQPRNSAALDALLNGIPVTRRDDMYDALLALRSFPKSFLLYRLDQAGHFIRRAELADEQSAAGTFFLNAAERAIGQVRNILEHHRTMSWRETRRESSLRQAIADLGARLAREGDQIWPT